MGLLRIPANHELGTRSRRLVQARLLGLVVLAAALVAASRRASAWPLPQLWGVWAVSLALNILSYLATARLVRRSAPARDYALVLSAQLVADVLVLTALLHLSGGIENPLVMLYAVLVALASSLLERRVALVYAAFASACWVTLLLLEAGGVLAHHGLGVLYAPTYYARPAALWIHGLLVTLVNLAVAAVASTVVAHARAGQSELRDAQQSCETRVQELTALADELRAVDEQRSQFIRVVTHELRAPVAAIKSLLQLILTGYVPPERHMEFIAKAEARATEQLELIGDLLDLLQVRAPAQMSAAEPCHVDAILADVMDMLQPRFAEQGLRVSIEVQPDLPPVFAAQEHVKQVWTNLISNAIKYNRPDGEVAVRLWSEGGQVCGCVRDTGIGIAPQDQARLFSEFYRTEEGKRYSRQGTGLGLAIVRAILERYGGRIWVESVHGEGSTFYFTLPCEPPEAPASAESAPG